MSTKYTYTSTDQRPPDFISCYAGDPASYICWLWDNPGRTNKHTVISVQPADMIEGMG